MVAVNLKSMVSRLTRRRVVRSKRPRPDAFSQSLQRRDRACAAQAGRNCRQRRRGHPPRQGCRCRARRRRAQPRARQAEDRQFAGAGAVAGHRQLAARGLADRLARNGEGRIRSGHLLLPPCCADETLARAIRDSSPTLFFASGRTMCAAFSPSPDRAARRSSRARRAAEPPAPGAARRGTGPAGRWTSSAPT